jgi:hypothetical protein
MWTFRGREILARGDSRCKGPEVGEGVVGPVGLDWRQRKGTGDSQIMQGHVM